MQAQLVSIADARCRYHFQAPTCAFDVTMVFASGEVRTTRYEASFARDAHAKLSGEVIVTGDADCPRPSRPVRLHTRRGAGG